MISQRLQTWFRLGRPEGRPRAAPTWLKSLLVVAAVALGGCSTLQRVPAPLREPSFVVDPAATPLGKALAPAERQHPGLSGFDLVSYGLEALVARTAIVDASTRSVDAQYYIYAADQAGSLFLLHLLNAAQRGVRVRLLLDDYNLRDDGDLALLATQPNFQIRIFNPVPYRARWAHFPEYALTFARADRRMHNKLLIGDNAVAILGGRNIADNYFSLEAQANFRDFDLLAAGPAVHAASAAFDEYWNSPYAVPVGELIHRHTDAAKFAALMQRIMRRAKPAEGFERQYEVLRPRYLPGLLGADSGLVWAHGEIVADSPARVSGNDLDGSSVARRLDEEWHRAQHEVLVEAAYFLPGKEGVAEFREMAARGVKVKILTCALATTDVPLVYTAYEKYRPALLAAGVDLREYRVKAPGAKPSKLWYRAGHTDSVLHSKAIVFDERRIWIGSLNLTPRSSRLNTEVAAVVDSPVLARRLAADIHEDMDPAHSWVLQREDEPGSGTQRIVWRGEQNGRMIIRTHEPASWLRRFDNLLLSVLPAIENQL